MSSYCRRNSQNKELEETKRRCWGTKKVPEEQPKKEIKEDEETITLTKAELEEIKKQKYAEEQERQKIVPKPGWYISNTRRIK